MHHPAVSIERFACLLQKHGKTGLERQPVDRQIHTVSICIPVLFLLV